MPPTFLLAESPWLAPLLFTLGCAMLAVILLRRSWRHLEKAKKRPPGDSAVMPATSAAGGRSHDASRERDRLNVELYDLARDTTAQIDTKLALLRELIAQSDRQIARLEELLHEASEERHKRQ